MCDIIRVILNRVTIVIADDLHCCNQHVPSDEEVERLMVPYAVKEKHIFQLYKEKVRQIYTVALCYVGCM